MNTTLTQTAIKNLIKDFEKISKQQKLAQNKLQKLILKLTNKNK